MNSKDGPRGEILLSSKSLAKGYYNCPDQMSNASFYTDSESIRWFRTGDVGHLNLTTGSLRIIDRRKDLFRLHTGECVSLSKVESEIKMHWLVDTVCVYASPTKTATVALILPNEEKLFELKEKLNILSPPEHADDGKFNHTKEDLCKNDVIVCHVLKDMTKYVSKRLQNFEIPKAVKLVSDVWSPDTGLVSSAMKLKRKPIQRRYQQDIDQMYDMIAMSKAKQLSTNSSASIAT